MSLLVLTMDYPRLDGKHERMYVHTRDIYYKKSGLEVTVLNFSCKYDYRIDDIQVISLATYKKNRVNYDIAISHASNLRNHYLFLRKYGDRFKKVVFFFHGHEILYLNEAYPKPYPYAKKGKLKNRIFQGLYDHFKIAIWAKYYKQIAYKSEFVFVSHWIKNQFRKNTGLSNTDLMNHCHIINNSVGVEFESNQWDYRTKKNYDFITVRSNLDGSKYGIDLVMELAEKNPSLSFLLIGKGEYFKYNLRPNNVKWINRTMNHDEMLKYLDASECGILLTREDTQGVMTCEFATYGIPVITSDINVCHEFFEDMPNVRMISNNNLNVNICEIKEELLRNAPYNKNNKYFGDNTIKKEIKLYQRLLNETTPNIKNVQG